MYHFNAWVSKLQRISRTTHNFSDLQHINRKIVVFYCLSQVEHSKGIRVRIGPYYFELVE